MTERPPAVPSEVPLRAAVRGLAAPALAALVATGLVLGLLGLWPWELAGTRLVGAFHDGHVWAFEHVARGLVGLEPASGVTERIGYPGPVLARFIAWLPALVVAPLQPLLGPLGAYNVALLLGPALAVVAAWALLRRATGIDAWSAAGLSLGFALCPYALGVLASGQIAKLWFWLLPASLLAHSVAVRGPGRVWGILGCGLAAAALGFTSPSTAIYLPIAAGLWVVAELLAEAPRWRPRRFAWAGLALAVTALGLLPARLYHGDLRRAGLQLAFEPRAQDIAALQRLPLPPPMAQPEGLLWGSGGLAQQAWDASHVVYLGLPLLIAGLLLGLRRGPGRGRGWGLLILGVLLALGPALVSGDAFVMLGGERVPLPAALLDAVGYPTRHSGMVYRAVVLAALGLPLLVAAGWPRRGRWWVLAAWGLGLLQVADGWRVTRTLWPPPSGRVPGAALLAEIAADPAPGAVLDLPLIGGTWENGNAMVAATQHRRATTALPRQTASYLPETARLARLVDRALAGEGPEEARGTLAREGFRYLCWRPWLDPSRRLDSLEARLGPALGDEELYCWVLD
jgi:hypothetical protein